MAIIGVVRAFNSHGQFMIHNIQTTSIKTCTFAVLCQYSTVDQPGYVSIVYTLEVFNRICTQQQPCIKFYVLSLNPNSKHQVVNNQCWNFMYEIFMTFSSEFMIERS